ncbi:Protein zwilch-like [Hondaea fermentalgiana]|uniref:Protein zwilch-like n=1 Tax=Hondaea fermentalgiana TaxID=2315210 RepID=A0A2R5FZZ8_9STRA|nr:Protein zwilch-like [Hondaea fermentalgiana]|eukprot:GBG24320.1 Protein zwilch-like [Hondaea fermentalgiana]
MGGRDADAADAGDNLREALTALRDGGVFVDEMHNAGFLRVGPTTFHPAAAALARAAEAAKARRGLAKVKPEDDNASRHAQNAGFGFWLCFGIDLNLREACNDARDPAPTLARLCELALIEPVDMLPGDAKIVVVGSASITTTGAAAPGTSDIVGEALTRAEALERDDLKLGREVLARQKVVTRNARPVGDLNEARKLVALLADLVAGLDEPVVVVADQGALVGAWTDRCGDEDACTLISSELPPSLRADGQLTTQTLSSTFSDDGKDVARMEASATYELLGNAADATGCVALLARWTGSRTSPCRLLGPPALIPDQALLMVRGTPLDAERLPEARSSSIFLPDPDLIVLNRLQTCDPDDAINLGAYQPEASWARRVQAFFRSAVSGTLFSRARGTRASGESHTREGVSSPEQGGQDAGLFDDHDDLDLDTSDLMGTLEPGHRVLRARTNLDFTEHLWRSIIVRAEKLEDILYALREMVGLLEGGKLLPYIHKSNKSMLGVICRLVVQRQAEAKEGDSATQDVASSESAAQTLATFTKMFAQSQMPVSVQAVVMKHLVRLGTFKLKRDFEGWFSEIGMVMPSDSSDALADLVRLRNALQTVATALAVQCPLAEAKQVAQVCLAHPDARTLLVPLRSQLPWVKGGDAGLPTARSWQLEQQDKRGDLIQTTRLTPLAPTDLPRSDLSLSREAVSKAVAMLDAEPDGIIRSMISYPADATSSSSSSSSSSSASQVRDKCMCIQTRRLCLV